VLATCSPVDDLVNDRSGSKSCPAAETRASAREVGDADALLVARLAAGDHVALTEAFDRLASAVYRGALGVLGHDAAAQDVVQDVFVELWTHPVRYDPEAGSLRGYLTMQARHRAVDLVRSELRRMARQERSNRLDPGQPDDWPGEQMVASEAAAAVRAAVEMLPENQRLIIELAYFHELTCREAAKAAGIPEGTAKSRLRLALAKLETLLDRQLLEPS
jgi:RNA polymerase sigma-70 factor, ECF subfamily